MVSAIIQYDLAPSFTYDRVRKAFEQAVPKFEKLPGLIRKYFLAAEDGRSAGSVYLWESREQALAFHNAEWREFMRQKYGHKPTVTILDCLVVVDNAAGEVLKG